MFHFETCSLQSKMQVCLKTELTESLNLMKGTVSFLLDISESRLLLKARMIDGLGPCTHTLWLNTSAEAITSVSAEEDTPGNHSASSSFCPALDSSSFFLLLSPSHHLKAGFHSLTMSRIPSSS